MIVVEVDPNHSIDVFNVVANVTPESHVRVIYLYARLEQFLCKIKRIVFADRSSCVVPQRDYITVGIMH